MDYGLIGGMAQGVNQGLQALQQAMYRKQDLKRQGYLDTLKAREAGYDLNAETGEFKETPLHAAQQGLLREQYDPNSPLSQSAHTIAKKRYQIAGIDQSQLPENRSAAEYEAYGKPLSEVEKYQTAREASRIKVENTNTTKTNKDWDALTKAIDPNKGRAGNLAQVKQLINQAEHLDSLYDQTGGNMTGPESTELAMGVASMYKRGGQTSEAQVHGLIPSSVSGSVEDVASWLTNKPRGREQQEFVKRMMDSIHRQKEIAVRQLHEAQYGAIGSYSRLEQTDPTQFASVLSGQGLDPEEFHGLLKNKGHLSAAPAAPRAAPAQGAAGAHPEDDAAVAWARANPKDPRSVAILKANGL